MLGVKKCLAHLDRIINAIENDAPKAIEEEVILRTENASAGFASAPYDGSNDVVVYPDLGQTEWAIHATGGTVLFIEYGTGLRFKHDSQFGNYDAYPPGSWSEWHSRFLVEPKWNRWHDWWPVPGYGPVLGNPSANIMYDTRKNLQSTVPIKAKRAIDKAVKL